MISHSLVGGHSYIQSPSRGPFQSSFSGLVMKESRLKMSPRLQFVPPVVHHRTWTDNQKCTLLMAKLSLREKK